jgi:RNA polymerase sigma factor (TIGR02999 family)
MEACVHGSRRRLSKKETESPNELQSDVTQLLGRWREGDASALESLTERIYEQLRCLADDALGKDWAAKSLQPTELVHEAYLRLFGAQKVDWNNRSHFFAVASRLMRQILVDRARNRNARKRGGNATKISIDADFVDFADPNRQSVDLVELDLALKELAQQGEELSRLVELRFFVGMTVEETAGILGVSSRTVKRDWKFAKAWLKRRLSAAPGGY